MPGEASKKSSHKHLSKLFSFSSRSAASEIDFHLAFSSAEFIFMNSYLLSCVQSLLDLSPTMGRGISESRVEVEGI